MKHCLDSDESYQVGRCGEDGESFLQEILNGLKNIYPQSVLHQILTAEPADISSFYNFLFLISCMQITWI